MNILNYLKDRILQLRIEDRNVCQHGNWEDFIVLKNPSLRVYRKMASELGVSGHRMTPRLKKSIDHLFKRWELAEQNYGLGVTASYLIDSDYNDILYSKRYKNSIVMFRKEMGVNISPSCRFLSEKCHRNSVLRERSLQAAITEPLPATKLTNDVDIKCSAKAEVVLELQRRSGIKDGVPFDMGRDFEWVNTFPNALKEFHLTDADMVMLYDRNSKFLKYFSEPCCEIQLSMFRENYFTIYEMKDPQPAVLHEFLSLMTSDSSSIAETDCEHVKRFINDTRTSVSDTNRSVKLAQILGRDVDRFSLAYDKLSQGEKFKIAFFNLKEDTGLSFNLSNEIFNHPLFSEYRDCIREALESVNRPCVMSESEKIEVSKDIEAVNSYFESRSYLSNAMKKADKDINAIQPGQLDELLKGKSIALSDGTKIKVQKTVCGGNNFIVIPPLSSASQEISAES